MTELERQQQAGERVLVAGSIEEALGKLAIEFPPVVSGATAAEKVGETYQPGVELGRVFVIGGAEIYALALEMENCERVLWTRLERESECDVWFKGGLLIEGQEGAKAGWMKRADEDLDAWSGEKCISERKEEGGVSWKVEMWEKEKERRSAKTRELGLTDWVEGR